MEKYTQRQIEAFKIKADKWDALEKEVSELYAKLDAEENDEGLDLVGEIAAIHLGFM